MHAPTHHLFPPPTMSLLVATVLPITFILFLIKVWWDRHWRLQNLPTPVCFFVHGGILIRSDPPLQARTSLAWGHEKFAFEDDQGCQWRAWFNECGRAFKIKAAWGHPEIVRNPKLKLGPRLSSIFMLTSNTVVDYGRYWGILPYIHKERIQLPPLAPSPFSNHPPRWPLSRLGRG